MRVRFSALAWDWGVDALLVSCLPSLFQPDNIPWLVRNGFELVFTVYTTDRDVPRLHNLLGPAFGGIGAPPGSLHVNVVAAELKGSAPNHPSIKRNAFIAECQNAIADRSPVMGIGVDGFYGNGSVRNLTVYCQKPGVVAAGIYLRVKRDPFLELVRQFQEKFPGRPISNARLVDMGLLTQIDALADCSGDKDRNTSFHTGGSFRKISDDVISTVQHLPSPYMFWPTDSDLAFFDAYGAGRHESIDHLWGAKLMAEGRWRYLASSDLFFLVELTPADVEEKSHVYPLEDGRLYNETFYYQLPHTLMNEMTVATLRREPFLS